MPPISTKAHGASDYATGLALIGAPRLMRGADGRSTTLLRIAGVTTLLTSAATDYELGLWRKLPMPVHLLLDGATGAILTGSALLLGRRGAAPGGPTRHSVRCARRPRSTNLLPHAIVGVGEIALAALTVRVPGDRAVAGTQEPPDPGELLGTPSGAGDPGSGMRERTSSVVRPPEPSDALVAQEESAAAAEAAAIGGFVPPSGGDPAMEPVYQAGGGEQEGWEQAEADLIENATHGEGHGDPLHDAFSPEAETDRTTLVYGETDQLPSTEVVADADTAEADAASGPNPSADRSPGVPAEDAAEEQAPKGRPDADPPESGAPPGR
jgi:hypothetical protein